MARQSGLVSVIHAHMAIAVEIQFGGVFAGLSIPWPVPRSSGLLAPSPGTTVSVSPAGSALPGFDPAPVVCPIRPALGNAVVPATGSAPAPSTPAAGRGSPCHKIPSAVGTTELYSSAVLPPTGPAAPAALHLARRCSWLETRSAPTPALPSTPPLVPA